MGVNPLWASHCLPTKPLLILLTRATDTEIDHQWTLGSSGKLTMLVMVWLCSRIFARPTSASLACLPVRSSSTFAGFTSKLITCMSKHWLGDCCVADREDMYSGHNSRSRTE